MNDELESHTNHIEGKLNLPTNQLPEVAKLLAGWNGEVDGKDFAGRQRSALTRLETAHLLLAVNPEFKNEIVKSFTEPLNNGHIRVGIEFPIPSDSTLLKIHKQIVKLPNAKPYEALRDYFYSRTESLKLSLDIMESTSPEKILDGLPRVETTAKLFALEEENKLQGPYMFLEFSGDTRSDYPLLFVTVPGAAVSSEHLRNLLSLNLSFNINTTMDNGVLRNFTVTDSGESVGRKNTLVFCRTGLSTENYNLFVAQPAEY